MSMDHLAGRRVVAINDPETEDWDWQIELDGDASIEYTGNESKPSNEIIDSVLGSAMLENETWTVEFYKGMPAEFVDMITGTEDELVISWPAGINPVSPVDPAEHLPPDPSSERLYDGPLNGS